MSTKAMTTLSSFENLSSRDILTHDEVERFHPAYYYKQSSTNTQQKFITQKLAKDDATLLERSPTQAVDTTKATKHHKSHSYSETLRSKAIVFKQDSFSGRNATSLNAESSENNRDVHTASAYIIQRDAATNELNYNSYYKKNNNNNSCNNSDYDFDDDDSEVVFDNTTAYNTNTAYSTDGDDCNVGGAKYLDDQSEDTCLLLPVDSQSLTSTVSVANPSKRAASVNNNSRYMNARFTSSACYRLHTFVKRNWYLNYLIPLSILGALMLGAYLTRDYAKRLLYWIETQNPWIIFAVFILLFIIVSFPIIVGYFVLMITSGYLFGFFKGLLTVILGANVGIALAHLCMHNIRHRIPMHRLIKNETGRAILRVISGPRAFKVVIFTRLTPIPFGLQNAIFGVSSINQRIYHAATFLGLLPAQTINVYLGSTLRSMHEVLNSHGTAVTGYISFVVEVICGVALMFWVVQKARKELSETLLDCSSSESKDINMQV